MKKRILLASFLTIALCFSLIFGATYALFTSESKVNIAVTSGKVKIEAKIENEQLYSMDVLQSGKFENGGTASFNEDYSVLTLTNVTPGDKITFDVVITNTSNVVIQYRVNWYVDGKLADVLVATAEDVALENGTSKWRIWEIPTLGSETRVIPVEIELPLEVGNDYQEEDAQIMFTVEAVQGNGTEYYDYAKCDVVATPETINEVLENVEAGTVIGLKEGFYDEIVLTEHNLTLYSNKEAVVGLLNVNAKDNTVVDGLVFDASKAKYVTTGGKSYYTNVVLDTDHSEAADNTLIKNCLFKGECTEDNGYTGIFSHDRGGQRVTGMTIRNNVFNVVSSYSLITLNYVGPNADIVIKDNEFVSNTGYVITSTSNKTKWVVKNNKFIGYQAAAIFSSQDVAGVVWDINNNEFSSPNAITTIAIKNACNPTVNVKDNTVPYGTLEKSSSNGYAAWYVIKLADNVKVVANSADLLNAIKTAGALVVLSEDVSVGTTQLAITTDVTIDLNGRTLESANNYGGISIKNGGSIKNGTINHIGNTAAIKAFQVNSIENVTINVTPTAGKVKGGIVVQSGSETYIETIKNVTITGATNGIETYNCGWSTREKPAIGTIENVTIDATDTGILLSASIGKAINCDIKGAKYGINMLLKGEFDVQIELADCTVTGEVAGIWAHDEVGISNTTNCSLVLTYDEKTSIDGGLVWDFEEECHSVITLNKPQ